MTGTTLNLMPDRPTQWLRGFRVLLGFAFRAAPREAGLFWLMGALMSLSGPATSLGAKWLVDTVVARDAAGAMGAALALALAAAVGLLVLIYYVDLLFTVEEKAGAVIDRRLMTLMVGTPGLGHHERPDYLKALDVLRQQRGLLSHLTNATAGIIRVVVQLAASVALLVQLHPILIILPLLGAGSFLASRQARDLQFAAVEATAESERLRRHLFGLAASAAAGKEIRVFGLQGELLARHDSVARAVSAARNRADWQSAVRQAAAAALFGFGYAGAIALVLIRAAQGLATPGDVVLTVGLAAGLNGVVQVAVDYGSYVLSVVRVAQRLLWLEDYAAQAHRASAAGAPASVPDRLRDGIELRAVTFRYPGTDRAVLNGVSLRLPAGKVVALVGENGAGKTTLVKLLYRFYEADDGRILVDGVDLRRLPAEEWRARTSAAFQDFGRFELLARETVGVGHVPQIEDAAAVRAALARAGGDDVPPRLPQGLETQLGTAWEGGVELSGGQWQKLALGRAMMRYGGAGPPLLVVFDEPTAALDAPTEHALFEHLASAARRGTNAGTVTMLVTHRFSTVRMADLIVVLERGRVLETGTHDDLMRRNGLYAELYTLQASAYR